MLVAGLTWEQARSSCPTSISLACHNAASNVTVSGPQEDIRCFVQRLQAQGVFAVEVQSCGFAFHSKYVISGAPQLVQRLEQVSSRPMH
ncbi:hypothetical protein PR048_020751 [Dryococelus australis]|uniref:Malonyl-CoA:ACP transacylase (MAT) domain-containing protein n=1 Tax=Dryococelus australis TaxID=614101 RepID=A0ABQ9GWC8_9NEOP|nr:hypothetical protein PR048_020751 [Dryococelus australis]